MDYINIFKAADTGIIFIRCKPRDQQCIYNIPANHYTNTNIEPAQGSGIIIIERDRTNSDGDLDFQVGHQEWGINM